MIKNKVKEAILQLLQSKVVTKQDVFKQTNAYFIQFKTVLQELVVEYNEAITIDDERIRLEYEDKGQFIAQLKVGGDVLVFQMNTNAFEFDRDHEIWKNEYVKENLAKTYCGVINIFNFLHDSFRYNRMNDLGYLIARVFINVEGHYFVEGKRQRGTGINHFGTSVVNDNSLRKIAETAILYSLEFDLLVPPYDEVKIITMEEMAGEIMNSKFKVGKRLGFRYNSDDVQHE